LEQTVGCCRKRCAVPHPGNSSSLAHFGPFGRAARNGKAGQRRVKSQRVDNRDDDRRRRRKVQIPKPGGVSPTQGAAVMHHPFATHRSGSIFTRNETSLPVKRPPSCGPNRGGARRCPSSLQSKRTVPTAARDAQAWLQGAMDRAPVLPGKHKAILSRFHFPFRRLRTTARNEAHNNTNEYHSSSISFPTDNRRRHQGGRFW